MTKAFERYCLSVSLLLVLTLATGCMTEAPTTELNRREGALPASRLGSTIGGLGPGDVISIKFSGAPELDLRQRIRGDGKVSLPMIGDVTAGGKSLARFQSELESRYRSRLQDPSVVVTRDATAAAVYVSGGVNSPLKIPLERPMTAMEAVMEAGGFSPAGNPSHVVVLRTSGESRRRFVLDLSSAMGDPSTSPFYLRPFDVVIVGKRKW